MRHGSTASMCRDACEWVCLKSVTGDGVASSKITHLRVERACDADALLLASADVDATVTCSSERSGVAAARAEKSAQKATDHCGLHGAPASAKLVEGVRAVLAA